MSDDKGVPLNPDTIDAESRPDDEGGLWAPPDLYGSRKAWWWFNFVVLVNLARLRFIVILVVIGIVIMKWDTLTAYYAKWTRSSNAAETGAGDVEYFCPMHPSVVRDHPDRCPICNMPLVKRKKGSDTPEALPAGVVNRVQLSPYRIVLAGVRTWPVDYVPLTREITTVGTVEFNERGEKTVSARVNGRIDKLLVNETGVMVRANEELASLYSPDLLVALQNLVDAKKHGDRDYLESARTKLQLLGISDDQINESLATGKATTHLIIRSPISGHVIRKYVREGQYVQEGMPLYELADLSTVWIEAQVYEDDIALLPRVMPQNPSQPQGDLLSVTATTRANPNEVFPGKLTFIYPHVDQDSRTLTVRFELKNPNHKLRPGSTATVTIKVPLKDLASLASVAHQDALHDKMLQEGRVLAVPDSAVIDTGSQKIVYREESPGVFDGVLVELGPRMVGPDDGAFYPVLRGIKRGDRVVFTGSFLVDAETRLNPAAGSIYFGGSDGGSGSKSSAPTVRPSTPEDGDAKVIDSLARLSEEDRRIAESQKFCPVLKDSRLGAMGVPVKVVIDGQSVFLCCPNCKANALKDPKATLAKAIQLRQMNTSGK